MTLPNTPSETPPHPSPSSGPGDVETMIETQVWATALPNADALFRQCHTQVHQALKEQTPEKRLAGTVCLLLTGDDHVQAMNLRFRQRDKPTNVLSFPGDPVADHLGDIAMAYETCAREAKEANVPFDHHATHLMIHGLLHLAGYDHIDNEDAREMEALEVDLLATFGIENPYRDGE